MSTIGPVPAQPASAPSLGAHMAGPAGMPMPFGMPAAPPPPQPVDPTQLAQAQATIKKPTWDDIIARFHDDRLRTFTIDIETDSTISPDEAAEQQAATQFIGSISQFVTAWEPILNNTPELADLACELLKFASRRFAAGRELETSIDEACDKLMAKAANPPSGGMDPKLLTAQAMAQAAVMKGQAEIAVENKKADAQIQREQMKAQAGLQLRAAEAQGNQMVEASKAQAENERAAIDAISDASAKHMGMPL